MSKKTLISFLILLVISMLFSACSTPNAAAPVKQAVEEAPPEAVPADEDAQAAVEPVELVVMHNWDPASDPKGAILADIFDAFMAENPDITVTQEIFADSEIPVKVETAFLAGQEPDIVFSNIYADTLLWPESGVTVPVNDYLEDWGLGSGYFLESALDNYTNASGQITAFPLEGFYWPVWYNTKAFEAAGVELPKTQEDLIAAAPKLREAGYQPFVTGGSDWTGFNAFLLMLQGSIPTDEALDLATNGGWADSGNALKGAELFVQMRDGGAFADNTEGLEFASMNEAFYTGKYAMMHGGSWSYAELPEEMLDSVVVAGFPIAADSPHNSPLYYGSFNAKGVWITRSGAEKIDAVGKLIQFVFDPENIARFVEETGMAPSLEGIEVDESKVNPLFIQSLSLFTDNKVVDQPETAFPAEIFGEVERVIRLAFLPNELSAQQILEELDKVYPAQ